MPYLENKTTKKGSHIKNLGWLIRHAAEIQSITVETSFNSCGEVFLNVELTNHQFGCYFASRTVCREWLTARRSFKRQRVNFEGRNIQL